MITLLPAQFSSLEDLVDEWVLPTEEARMRKRFGSSIKELNTFYGRMVEALPAIMAYLHDIEPKAMTPEDRTLLGLTLSLADVSVAVEKVKAPRSPAAFPGERLHFVHEGTR
jgi:hypothetical protein